MTVNKTVFLAALIQTLCVTALVHAQTTPRTDTSGGAGSGAPGITTPANVNAPGQSLPDSPFTSPGFASPEYAPVGPAPGPGDAEGAEPTSPSIPGRLSRWILYDRPWCCCPHGGDGPVDSEIYLRTGPSLPVGGGGDLSHTLEVGWQVTGGGRVLFFDTPRENAWVIDLGLGHTYNHGNQPNRPYNLFNTIPVSTRALHRTMVHLGLGKELYLLHTADTAGFNWRFGFDAGGNYGTARIDLNDTTSAPGSRFRRRGHEFGGAYLAMHSDVEYTCGCGCIWSAGVRVEWDYTWMNLIPPNNADLQDVNLLLTAGVRF